MTTFATRLATARPAPSFFTRFLRGIALHQQRNALLRLDPHLLNDIGITRAQALSEAARPAWDAPSHWLK